MSVWQLLSITQRLKTAPVSIKKSKCSSASTSQTNNIHLNDSIWTETITDHVLASLGQEMKTYYDNVSDYLLNVNT